MEGGVHVFPVAIFVYIYLMVLLYSPTIIPTKYLVRPRRFNTTVPFVVLSPGMATPRADTAEPEDGAPDRPGDDRSRLDRSGRAVRGQGRGSIIVPVVYAARQRDLRRQQQALRGGRRSTAHGKRAV